MFFWNASPPSGLKPKPFTDHRVSALNKYSYLAPLSLQQNWEKKWLLFLNTAY